MVVRSALVVAGLALSLLSFPSATAENTAAGQVFYFAPDNGLSPTPVDGLEVAVGWRAPVSASVNRIAYFEKTLTAGGNIAPVSAHYWVEAKAQAAAPPTAVVACAVVVCVDSCPMRQWMQVFDDADELAAAWNMCFNLPGVTGVIQPGTYELEVDFSWAEAVEAKPGYRIYTSIYTTGSSTSAGTSLYVVGDKAEHPSSMTWSGTSEPMPGSDSAPATLPNNSTATNSTTTSGPSSSGPSSSGTTGPKPSTTSGAPKPGEQGTESKAAPVREDAKKSPAAIGMLHGALLIAGFAILMRRRTA